MWMTREQISIQQSITSGTNKSEKEIVESLMERNDQEIRRREELIQKMEQELSAIKSRELPYSQVAKEILAQYPQITGFSIARGAQLDIQSFNPQEQIIVIINSDSEIPAKEIERLKGWLKVRLGFENLAIAQNVKH